MSGTANIIEGGCYHVARGNRGPQISRKYVILVIVIDIAVIFVTAYRLLCK